MYRTKLLFGFRKLWVALLLVTAAATASLVAGAPALIPKIQISSDPLYAASGGDKPAMTLALSVEFPTVGAQYPIIGSTLDATYLNTNEYLGYYNAESCYTYNKLPASVPAASSFSDYKRFDLTGNATNRMCINAFSGNFLNWASNSAIDMLRLALSGGDRYIDTTSLTVLQRAVLPNGDPICMWNSGNFPAKQLVKDGAGTGKYFGAIPKSMITNAAGRDIFIESKK